MVKFNKPADSLVKDSTATRSDALSLYPYPLSHTEVDQRGQASAKIEMINEKSETVNSKKKRFFFLINFPDIS